jgi:hypothetical protein
MGRNSGSTRPKKGGNKGGTAEKGGVLGHDQEKKPRVLLLNGKIQPGTKAFYTAIK